MKDLFVRRVYSKHGINIVVELDFVKKTASLTEKEGKKKQWLFAERSVEYMNGWLAILKAMEYAVTECKKELEAIEEREHQDFLEMYMALDKALKIDKGKN